MSVEAAAGMLRALGLTGSGVLGEEGWELGRRAAP